MQKLLVAFVLPFARLARTYGTVALTLEHLSFHHPEEALQQRQQAGCLAVADHVPRRPGGAAPCRAGLQETTRTSFHHPEVQSHTLDATDFEVYAQTQAIV
jgi:hypothetical protein